MQTEALRALFALLRKAFSGEILQTNAAPSAACGQASTGARLMPRMRSAAQRICPSLITPTWLLSYADRVSAPRGGPLKPF